MTRKGFPPLSRRTSDEEGEFPPRRVEITSHKQRGRVSPPLVTTKSCHTSNKEGKPPHHVEITSHKRQGRVSPPSSHQKHITCNEEGFPPPCHPPRRVKNMSKILQLMLQTREGDVGDGWQVGMGLYGCDPSRQVKICRRCVKN